jgi:hypothetical protein
MSLRTPCLLLMGAALAAACAKSPVEPVPPDPLGTYTLVSIEAESLPVPLPAQWDSGNTMCAQGETSERLLTGGRLEIREFSAFALELEMVEFCEPPNRPLREYPFRVLAQGRHSLSNDTLYFHVPVNRFPPEFTVLYTAPYHPQTLRLTGEEGVLEFVRTGS